MINSKENLLTGRFNFSFLNILSSLSSNLKTHRYKLPSINYAFQDVTHLIETRSKLSRYQIVKTPPHCHHRRRRRNRLLKFVPDIYEILAIVQTSSQNGLQTFPRNLNPGHVKRPMNLLRVAVLLRMARILQ